MAQDIVGLEALSGFTLPAPVAQNLPFLVLALAGVAAALVAVVVIVRARRAKRQAGGAGRAEAVAAGARSAAHWGSGVLGALRYLSTRRESRYRLPWVLLLGAAQSGKSSLVASLSTGRRQSLLLRERSVTHGCGEWSFFNRGVVIDPDGTRAAGESPAAERARRELFEQLNHQRPERPVDGVLLTLPARLLLGGDATALQALADESFRQLWEAQKQLAFSFPVYVVVTGCDAIPGFAAFWGAQQREGMSREMVGWSSPYGLAHRFTPEWVDEAFAELGGTLQRLLLDAAGGSGEISDTDAFFLFPQRFVELRRSLRTVLEYLFRSGGLYDDFPMRGIYFTGALPAVSREASTGAQSDALPGEERSGLAVAGRPAGARRDVAFADALFDAKVFRERNLAMPTRTGVLSRVAAIRRAQLVVLALFVLSFVALAVEGVRLNGQIDAALAAYGQLNGVGDEAVAGACVGREQVYALLGNVASIDVEMASPLIPLSWFDSRVTAGNASHVGDSTFSKVVFPSVACHLQKRIDELDGRRPPLSEVGGFQALHLWLGDYLDDLLELEKMTALFSQVAAYHSADRTTSPEASQELMGQFATVAEYVYGEPLPAGVGRQNTQLARALAEVTYNGAPSMDSAQRTAAAGQIKAAAVAAREQLEDQIGSGVRLLAELEKSPQQEVIERFGGWLQWVEGQWLNATAEHNPCQLFATGIGTPLGSLIDAYHYPDVRTTTLDAFGTAQCYTPSVQRLAALSYPPYGRLFTGQPGAMSVSADASGDLAGVRALSGLQFMALKPQSAFTCRLPLDGWQGETLAEAARYVREYQGFIAARSGDTQGAQSVLPLYERLARTQLQQVMDELLLRSQIATRLDDGSSGWLAPLSEADQELETRSSAFARVEDPLIMVLGLYRQLGFEASNKRVTQCVRDFSAQTLQRIETLAEASTLYSPPADPLSADTTPSAASGEPAGATRTFFALGNKAQTTDYLGRQLKRARVLANYASPFVRFLKNSESVNDANLANAQSGAYWEKSINELTRYIQFKETNGQVAFLDNLFLKLLDTLTPADCAGQLAAYASPALGNDLFSARRERLELQAESYCGDAAKSTIYDGYRPLAQRFNAELAGRFPFGPVAAADVSPAVVQRFFADTAAQRATLAARVKALKGEEWQEVVAFLEDLERAATFFDTALGDGAAPLTLDLAYRYASSSSRGADQLVAWGVSAGDESASYPNGGDSVTWSLGSSFAVSFDWAELSAMTPGGDADQSDLAVSGRNASFSADGAWALLRMARRHAVTTALGGLPPPKGSSVLGFSVPLTQGGTPTRLGAQLYLGVTVKGNDPVTKKPVALDLPGTLPASAPLVW